MTAYEVFLDWLKEKQVECKLENFYDIVKLIRKSFYSELDEQNRHCVIKANDLYVEISILNDISLCEYEEQFEFITDPDSWRFVTPYQTTRYK